MKSKVKKDFDVLFKVASETIRDLTGISQKVADHDLMQIYKEELKEKKG